MQQHRLLAAFPIKPPRFLNRLTKQNIQTSLNHYAFLYLIVTDTQFAVGMQDSLQIAIENMNLHYDIFSFP